jgi:hypothetical protein
MADEARVIGGRLWTCRRVVDPWGRKLPVRWCGYMDGTRVGFYRTKTEFWQAAEVLARQADDPQCRAAVEAEMRAAREGARLLDRLYRGTWRPLT